MNTKRKINGFTLIELMITLVLSLMITYAIAQVLISSNRSSVTSDGMSQSQETGRFVMSFLADQVRRAGLDSVTDENITAPAFVSCSDPAMAALIDVDGIPGNNLCSMESSLGVDPLANPGDRLAIAWVPSVPVGGPGLIRDCSGQGGYAADEIILNVFWVAFDPASGMNSLFCQGNAFNGVAVSRQSAPQAIANGVDSMHVLYGEATQVLPTNKDRNVTQYVHGGLPANGGVTNWDQVYAVKISILTRSLTAVTNSVKQRRYVLLDAPVYNLTDAVNRQVFNTTFAINNYY